MVKTYADLENARVVLGQPGRDECVLRGVGHGVTVIRGAAWVTLPAAGWRGDRASMFVNESGATTWVAK